MLHILNTGDIGDCKSIALDGRVHHVCRRSLHRVVKARVDDVLQKSDWRQISTTSSRKPFPRLQTFVR